MYIKSHREKEKTRAGMEQKEGQKKTRRKKTTTLPHKVKDNIFKTVFGEPNLFAEFLGNFIPIDILKDISPGDIEDISERYMPLFSDNKDSDTVKRINLNGENLFVISILEHESEVNYKSSFKMLIYIAYVLDDYIKENDKRYHEEIKKAGSTNLKLSTAMDFEYPPVLPIVFYDGAGEWTAERNFIDKTELSGVFEKYIPKFEYELVDLNKYNERDIASFGNTLSLIMIIDKIKTADGMSIMKNLPEGYFEQLGQNIPPHLHKLLADVITVFLTRINVPGDEIDKVTKHIYESIPVNRRK